MATKITLGKGKSTKRHPARLFQLLLFAVPSNLVDINELLSFKIAAFPLTLLGAGRKMERTSLKRFEEKSRSVHESNKQTKNDESMILE